MAAPSTPVAPSSSTPLIICTAAQFDSAEDPRVGALIGAAALASALGVPFLVLNSSTLERLSLGLAAAKAIVVETTGIRGAVADGSALREALAEGCRRLGTVEGVLAFMEPEQQDIVRWLPHLATSLFEGRADIVVPRRSASPTDSSAASADCAAQHHAEAFGKLYFDAQLSAIAGRAAPPPQLDWFFGVLLVRSSVVRRWISPAAPYEPRAVAFLLPLLQTIKAGARLETPEVNYVSTPRATAMAAWAACTALVDPAAVNPAQMAAGQVPGQPLPPTDSTAADGSNGVRGPSLTEATRQWERLASTIRQVGDEIRSLAGSSAVSFPASGSNGSAASSGDSSASAAKHASTAADGAQGDGSRFSYRLEDLLPKSAIEAMRQQPQADSSKS